MSSADEQPKKVSRLRRYGPLCAIILAAILFFASGLHRAISFDAIALQYADLDRVVKSEPLLAALAAIIFYAAVTALSLPLGLLVTVAMGLIFGWFFGAILVVIGATAGASILYFTCRLALEDFFRARAGGFLNRMAGGFRDNAWNYMLFLRLAPVFPFSVVNVVPAILGVPFRIYFITTLVGIIPGTVAFAFAGEGLRSIIATRAAACVANVAPCGEPLLASDLVTREIVIAFALLSVVALLPVVIKRFRGSKN